MVRSAVADLLLVVEVVKAVAKGESIVLYWQQQRAKTVIVIAVADLYLEVAVIKAVEMKVSIAT